MIGEMGKFLNEPLLRLSHQGLRAYCEFTRAYWETCRVLCGLPTTSNVSRPLGSGPDLLDEQLRNPVAMNKHEIIVGPFALQIISGFEERVIRFITNRKHTPVAIGGATHVRFGNCFGLPVCND